jgi:hypothetical protein
MAADTRHEPVVEADATSPHREPDDGDLQLRLAVWLAAVSAEAGESTDRDEPDPGGWVH